MRISLPRIPLMRRKKEKFLIKASKGKGKHKELGSYEGDVKGAFEYAIQILGQLPDAAEYKWIIIKSVDHNYEQRFENPYYAPELREEAKKEEKEVDIEDFMKRFAKKQGELLGKVFDAVDVYVTEFTKGALEALGKKHSKLVEKALGEDELEKRIERLEQMIAQLVNQQTQQTVPQMQANPVCPGFPIGTTDPLEQAFKMWLLEKIMKAKKRKELLKKRKLKVVKKEVGESGHAGSA